MAPDRIFPRDRSCLKGARAANRATATIKKRVFKARVLQAELTGGLLHRTPAGAELLFRREPFPGRVHQQYADQCRVLHGDQPLHRSALAASGVVSLVVQRRAVRKQLHADAAPGGRGLRVGHGRLDAAGVQLRHRLVLCRRADPPVLLLLADFRVSGDQLLRRAAVFAVLALRDVFPSSAPTWVCGTRGGCACWCITARDRTPRCWHCFRSRCC